MTGTGTSASGTSRAQSNPIAIVLVFGLVIASTTIIVVAGGSAISATQDQLGAQNAETKMTQLDSQMATVALGSSASQSVALGTSSNYKVNGSAGRINVTSSQNGTLLDTNLGEVVYQNEDGERVAYQGGGVWRAGATDGSVMVSPPEFHYQGGTLTLPLVTIANNGSFNGKAIITRNHSVQKYPNETLANPLRGGKVTIRITSDYHQAWGSYIESRTEATVNHVPGQPRTIEATLTVPVTRSFDYAVGTVDDDSDAITANPPSETDEAFEQNETGIAAPPADAVIDQKISECEPSDPSPSGPTMTSGTYCQDGDLNLGETDFDTSGGDIEVVVNGSLAFTASGGGPGSENYGISGPGEVTFYVKGNSIDLGSGNTGVNTAGDAEDLLILVHTDTNSIATGSGTPQFTGLLYAPGTDFSINGGGNCGRGGGGPPGGCQANFVGSAIVKSADAGGNGDVDYAGSIDRELNFDSAATINYLHVSENSVNVTAD